MISGKKISSFRLTLDALNPPLPHTLIFFKVIVVQRCPLFHSNTLSNCARQSSTLRANALPVTTEGTVADAISYAIDAYI